MIHLTDIPVGQFAAITEADHVYYIQILDHRPNKNLNISESDIKFYFKDGTEQVYTHLDCTWDITNVRFFDDEIHFRLSR